MMTAKEQAALLLRIAEDVAALRADSAARLEDVERRQGDTEPRLSRLETRTAWILGVGTGGFSLVGLYAGFII